MHEAGCEAKDCQSSCFAFAAVAEYRNLVNTETSVSFWCVCCAQTIPLTALQAPSPIPRLFDTF